MKRLLILAFSFVAAHLVHGQGVVIMQNRVIFQSPRIYAPVYGVNPAAPDVRLSGNAFTNGGTTDYRDVPLVHGTGYTASLWAAPATPGLVEPELQLLATTPFNTQPSLGGIFGTKGGPSTTDAQIPFVTVDNTPVTFQVRVWDNRGGLVSSWAAAMADPTVPKGYSDTFTTLVRLSPNAPEPLAGLTSFNLTIVPEPSLLALGVMGALAGFVAWRRRGLRSR